MHLFVNWLLHGTAVTIAVAMLVRGRGSMSAATRERVWRATAVGLTLMPAAYLLADVAASTSSLVAAARLDPPVMVHGSWNDWATLIGAVWAVWTVASLARYGLSLARLRRTKQSAEPFPREREARLPMWMTMRGRGRAAQLVVSSRVHRAGVLGLGRPMIAVAPGTIARLTDEELDQIVLHEYAHIQRRDDLVILAQRMMSALVGLHPALWWLDRELTLDREVACDDWVVAFTGARARYARCLVNLAGPGPTGRRSLVPGAVWSRSQLSIRVAALLDVRRAVAIAPSRVTCLLAAPSVLALVAVSVTMPLVGVSVAMPLVGVTGVRPAQVLMPMRVAGATILESGPTERAPRAIARAAPDSARARPATSAAPVSGVEQTAPPAETPMGDARDAVEVLPAMAVASIAVAVVPVGGRVEIETKLERDPPWRAAADAGLAIGAGSRFAARKTAAAFARFGKSFANPF